MGLRVGESRFKSLLLEGTDVGPLTPYLTYPLFLSAAFYVKTKQNKTEVF